MTYIYSFGNHYILSKSTYLITEKVFFQLISQNIQECVILWETVYHPYNKKPSSIEYL